MTENRLASLLAEGTFVVTCEMIPGRGANEAHQGKELEIARELAASGRIHAMSITDNPSGNPALLADCFAEDLLKAGVTPLVHMSCKDRNRSQLESQLWALERRGIANVLAMTGDYPVSGFSGRPRPVFDLDSVHLLQMVSEMNRGLQTKTPKGSTTLLPTHFNPGAVTSPFKWTEGELLPQYYKLEKKIVAGARFIISQVGYDARKMDELIRYLRLRDLSVPLIANIFILSAGVGRIMNAGNFPGCFVSDDLLAVLQQDAKSEDKGKAAYRLRAAKMIAIARGLGYAGVHIGGINITAADVDQVLDTADELQGDWQEFAREITFGKHPGFYLFERDPKTGLNLDVLAKRYESRLDGPIKGNYPLSRVAHKIAFTKDKGLYPAMSWVSHRGEAAKGAHRGHRLEHIGKVLMYGCQDCGDCGLHATAYTCPMSQCPKCQRNGPCGGSSDGWCEVYPGERYCIYYKAYHRLKHYGKEASLSETIWPPVNWDFFQTSAWSNYHHDRDNYAHGLSMPKRPEL